MIYNDKRTTLEDKVEIFVVLQNRGYLFSHMSNILNFRGHNFHDDKIIKLMRWVINFQHADIKNRKKIVYVNKKRNESNIFDNFNEEE